ncbi:Y4yA family PLP-dependent enzyme [Paractinoplanes brasiliensis]|uniref:Diaminopimelate decarboxylase n=1 Tax=Paractinoplanes brasiliensis TaxID=52695 RepID=A0A4R6K1E2_9ACTN|nr:Y4yA family PLP-dependent enzyme [Actinoplanes brasiliensis]TDO41921.1 diaminopimelate decarboxylase [Actinoplanes brasiliensis]GID29797.1 diaminopimelate decarboxylase [Actinoplanes brasiliensis]
MASYLEARVEGDLRALLQQHDLLRTLVDAFGSPLNLVLPDQLVGNVEAFRAVHRDHRLAGQIFFAHKANRSSALVRELAATDAGIDVASLGELQHALGAGFAGHRIMATGPKSRDFLWLAARVGAVVNADSTAELTELAGLVAAHGLPPVRVMARLSGFSPAGVNVLVRASRFGIPADDLGPLWEVLEKYRDELDLHGFAYHLDTVGLPEKIAALEGCLRVLDEALERGLNPVAVDIGGGFGVNYLAHGAQWEQWTTELTSAVLGRTPPLTWNGHGYGLRNENGKVRGVLGLYPAYRPLTGAAYLDRLLASESPSLRRPLGSLLLESMGELYTEPGRALLDQCGVVLTRVEEVRPGPGGDLLIRVAANARDISLEEHGVLLDPVLVGGDRPGGDGPYGVYLLGNLCLESDLITRRKVFLPTLPSPGDLLAFPNTAGYFMDFSAGRPLMQPTAQTIAAYRDGGSWLWCLDEQYWPVDRREGTA